MKVITEDYVSFETAKLLEEKGFDELTIGTYNKDGKLVFLFLTPNNWNSKFGTPICAPTLQMTMKWLRVVHKIHIIAEPCFGEENESNLSFNKWFWTILKEEGEYKPIRKIDEFSTYEQACETAIKYCLENLI